MKLPIGLDSFEKIRTNDFYYVDKTQFIKELLENWGEVNQFTRPRRFGKSLNMSMLKSFFEIGSDPALFDGLKISREKELCGKYQGKFPVISISLKGVDGRSFFSASAALRTIIGNEAMRFQFLKESEKLSNEEKEAYRRLIQIGSGEGGLYAMTEEVAAASLKVLSQLLAKHCGQKAILLIDEYDVPLDKAFQAGYYEEMVDLIRNLLGNVLKTNDSLFFAVLTGCLRISKESIFTGLNNLKIHTISDVRYDEFFGFTDGDVEGLLEYYGLSVYKEAVRSWYVRLRLVDLQPFHQPAVLLRRQLPHLFSIPRPLETPALQPFVQQHKAVAFPVQRFDPVFPPPAEQEQRIGKRV